MIPTLLASGIILYGIIQLIAAIIAVILAVKWKKFEFLPGLSFILLYAIIEVIDLFFFTDCQQHVYRCRSVRFYPDCNYILYYRDAPGMVSETGIRKNRDQLMRINPPE